MLSGRLLLIICICVLFIVFFLSSSQAEFAEVPKSVTVEIGIEPAVFKCRHMSVDAIIGWRVNNFSVGEFPNISQRSINEDGNSVNTLVIPARSEYNGTEVVCVGLFFGESRAVMTNPATLTIIDSPLSTTPPTTTPSSTSPPATTSSATTATPSSTTSLATTEVLTTLPLTTGLEDFELTPSPLTVAVEQGRAVFKCQHSLCDFVNWVVNKTSSDKLPNVTESIQNEGNILTYLLSFDNLDGYNRSEIQCLAVFVDGSPTLFTEPAMLLIQGTPGKVQEASSQRNYTSNALITTWNPLFSLDINGTDPDIVYSVEVFKITCGQNLFMNHTVAMDNSSTQEGLDMMEIYRAVIAAKNNVSEALNGPSVTINNETFLSLHGFTLFSLARDSHFTLQSLDPVPSYYTLSLESLDGSGQTMFTNVSVERSGETINMRINGHKLPPKSLWNVIIQAYGCEVHRVETKLSTHDIQNVTVTTKPSLPGQIRIKGDFVANAAANGAFVIVYSLTDYSDVHYIAKQDEETIDINIMNLPGTEYNVSVFSLENGRPFERAVSSTKRVTVTTTGDQESTGSPLPMQYDIQPATNGVRITCNFTDLDDTLTDCLVVVHRQISRLSSSGLMNIVSSHMFERFGDIAYGYIDEVDMEQYQIGAVGIKRVIHVPSTVSTVAGVSNSIAGAAVGAALAVVLVLIIAVLAAVIGMLVVLRRRSKPFLHDAEDRLMSDAAGSAENGSVGGARYAKAMHLSSDLKPHDASHEGKESPHHDPESSTDPTYAQVTLSKPEHNLPPPETDKVVYDDPQKFVNAQGQIYAITQVDSPSVSTVVDDAHKVIYSEVQPHSMTQCEEESVEATPVKVQIPNIEATTDKAIIPNTEVTPEEAKIPDPTPSTEQEALTAVTLFPRLLPYSSKFMPLGKALMFDEDRLDEIFTNNETEEDCLRELIDVYLARSHLEPSWEKIDAALTEVENSTATEDVSTTSVQETDSSNISQVVNGSTEFPQENHANAQSRKPFPIPVGAAHLTASANGEHLHVIVDGLDKQTHAALEGQGDATNDTFVSQTDLQISAPSSESGSDDSQSSLLRTSKPSDDDDPSTADQLCTLPVSCFPALAQEPVDDNDCVVIQPFSTVCSQGHEEDLLCQPSPMHCQESDEEETDYNAAMKQLLGISKEPPPEFHENTDTESDVEQLLPTSGRIEKRAPPSWNCLNLNKSNVGMHAHALSRDFECIE